MILQNMHQFLEKITANFWDCLKLAKEVPLLINIEGYLKKIKEYCRLLKLLWWFSGIVDQQVRNMAGGLSGLEFCACQKKSSIRFIFDDF